MKTISCQIGTDMLIYNSVVKDLPACRNGRRGRLKICCGQPRMGSSPIAGSKKAQFVRTVLFLLSLYIRENRRLTTDGFQLE